MITDSDKTPAYVPLETDETLSRDLGIAITHIANRNWFDKQDLIELLKRARRYIDQEHEVPAMLRRQAN